MKMENTTSWENVVAMAAPAVPSAGTKPYPYINRGSRTMLNINPVATIFNGVLLSPCPLYSPLYVLLLNVKNRPGVTRRMYMMANSEMFASRWNNPTNMGAAM